MVNQLHVAQLTLPFDGRAKSSKTNCQYHKVAQMRTTTTAPTTALEGMVHPNSFFDLDGIVIEQEKGLCHLSAVYSTTKKQKPKGQFYPQGGDRRS